jgi:hypothetical protein
MNAKEMEPLRQIAAINQKINQIISKIQFKIAEELTDRESGGDFESNLMGAQHEWPQFVYVPTTKDEAIRILEDPSKSQLDKLGAQFYAEMYKKRQLQIANGIESRGDGITWSSFDSE